MILNEKELLHAARTRLAARVEPLRFATMPFAAQVAAMTDVSVLVGMQGAGMTNGIFLPTDATAVVLYELGAVEDLFAELLRPRGPYLAWVNKHEANSVCDKAVDRFCDSPDTVVDASEFLLLMAKALKLSGTKTIYRKQSLSHD